MCLFVLFFCFIFCKKNSLFFAWKVPFICGRIKIQPQLLWETLKLSIVLPEGNPEAQHCAPRGKPWSSALCPQRETLKLSIVLPEGNPEAQHCAPRGKPWSSALCSQRETLKLSIVLPEGNPGDLGRHDVVLSIVRYNKKTATHQIWWKAETETHEKNHSSNLVNNWN